MYFDYLRLVMMYCVPCIIVSLKLYKRVGFSPMILETDYRFYIKIVFFFRLIKK